MASLGLLNQPKEISSRDYKEKRDRLVRVCMATSKGYITRDDAEDIVSDVVLAVVRTYGIWSDGFWRIATDAAKKHTVKHVRSLIRRRSMESPTADHETVTCPKAHLLFSIIEAHGMNTVKLSLCILSGMGYTNKEISVMSGIPRQRVAKIMS